MPEDVLLRIQIPGRTHPPKPGQVAWNEHCGGPEMLLRWLETNLGHLAKPLPLAVQIHEYARILEGVPGAIYHRSLERDRWATAVELLSRRTDLRFAGWDEKPSDELPRLVHDMALAVQKTAPKWLDESKRIRRVLAALEAGQILPPHRCVLSEAVNLWPRIWQEVLAHIETEVAPTVSPAGSDGTTLWKVQAQAAGGEPGPVQPDESFRWLEGLSVYAACEAIAHMLARDPGKIPGTVICCEDDGVALCMDECLSSRGLPTAGASHVSPAHPALQVLPLALELLWDPVDPALLLDFLSLPVSPIPRRVARELSDAVGEQPGLGSDAWVKARDQLCDPGVDTKKRARRAISEWLEGTRYEKRGGLPADTVAECCRRVARWAAAKAGMLESNGPRDRELARVLFVAAGQATAMADLAASHGGALTEPQLRRMLETVLASGVAVTPNVEAHSGPRRVASLAEVTTPCDRLVWLGLGTADHPGCRWTGPDLKQLRAVDLDLDDGSRALSVHRAAERRGLCQVKQNILCVGLPIDAEFRPHPLWLLLRRSLEEGGVNKAPVLERVIAGAAADMAPWQFATSAHMIVPHQPQRTLWTVDSSLLQDRDKSSATSLETRLACPIKWVLTYQAKLKPGPIAGLPDGFLLKGSFCHGVMERVLGGGGSLPEVEEVVMAVGREFDRSLPLNAAPLAQPSALLERRRLRDELLTAARRLVEALHSGGYRVKGMEVEVKGTVHGRELTGAIDCLAADAQDREAIIDFKYAGRNKYRRFLEEGRATQLATYAHARSQHESNHGRFPDVAYLILCDGILYTTEQDRLRGGGQMEALPGPGSRDVWEQFAGALQAADGWLQGQEPVPARPLQTPEEWPGGVDALVLEGRSSQGNLAHEQPPCKYCNFEVLCGLKEVD